MIGARERVRRGASAWLALVVVIVTAGRLAIAAPLLDGLATDDPAALALAVRAIEAAPTTPELADALFAAGRACEDRLLDPARALAIYDRLLRELPYARVAAAAQRRATRLRGIVGPAGEHAREAGELARLIAAADELAIDEVVARGTRLGEAAWPGAAEAALWLADFLRRVRRFDAAQAQYAAVATRWPGSPQAETARRSGAGNAIDAGAWDLAERLALALPHDDVADRIVRDDLLAAAARGRRLHRLLIAAWIAIGLVLVGLLASLAEAALRGGRRAPALRPPLEVWFLAPMGGLVVAYAHVARPAIATAVTAIAVGGLGLSWLSGATLDLLRARARPLRLRATVHVVGCALAVVAIGYVAVVQGDLIDLLVETVRSGPEG